MVCVNGISAAYTLASASASWVDIVAAKIVAYMMVTSMAVVAGLLYLAYNGDRDVMWCEACSSYAAFCDKTRIALILHFVSLLCSLAIILACRTFRDFNSPFILTKEEAEEE